MSSTCDHCLYLVRWPTPTGGRDWEVERGGGRGGVLSLVFEAVGVFICTHMFFSFTLPFQNADLLTLTYGAIVARLLKDYQVRYSAFLHCLLSYMFAC